MTAASRIGQSLLSSSHDELSSDATSVSLTSAVLEHNTLEIFQSSGKGGDQPILASTGSSPAPSSAHWPATAEDGCMDDLSDDDHDNVEDNKESESTTGTGRPNEGHESDSDAIMEANDNEEIEDTWPTRPGSLPHFTDTVVTFEPIPTILSHLRQYAKARSLLSDLDRELKKAWEALKEERKADECWCKTYQRQKLRQGRERDRSRCTTCRPPLRMPFPPAFDYPQAQDLEDLIAQQQRHVSQEQRRSRVMQSFRSTHSKFTRNVPELMDAVPTEAWDSLIVCHRVNPKQAWKDGVAAAQRLLSGILPRELHSVLGVAQIASAIRYAMDDIDSPAVSEEKFLVDLGRWMQLLPSDSHVAFDYYAHMLWDNRPPSDPAWEETQDQGKLRYFQGYLADMLSYTGSSPPEIGKIESILPPPDATLCPTIFATDHPVSCSVAPKEVLPGVENALETPNHKPEQTTFQTLVSFSAGAIFALILAYLLRKSHPLISCT